MGKGSLVDDSLNLERLWLVKSFWNRVFIVCSPKDIFSLI